MMNAWWTHSVLYITGTCMTGVRVCTSYITLPFTWYSLHANFMSLHELTKYDIFSNTSRNTEACYVFLALAFYDRKYIVYLYMSFIHSSTWNSCVILKHNGFSFMFNSWEEVARGWSLIILSTSYSYLLWTYSSFSREYV
jgi:hypothetical protein